MEHFIKILKTLYYFSIKLESISSIKGNYVSKKIAEKFLGNFTLNLEKVYKICGILK